MEKIVNEIKKMLESNKLDIDFNEVVKKINERRYLGSGNQCYSIMYKVCQYFDIKSVLEIGTHQGASSIIFCQAILDNNKIPQIHTIDNWSQAAYEELAKNNIDKSSYSEYIKMYNGDSLIKVPEIFNKIGNVDLVFIDGNHTIDYVIKDYNNCKDYSNLILFHDTKIGNQEYLRLAEKDGYIIYNFETRYAEGDNHLIGIALAVK
jgi:predicted O-methyltransferase YrrM